MHRQDLTQFSLSELVGISIPRYPVLKDDNNESTESIPVSSAFLAAGKQKVFFSCSIGKIGIAKPSFK